MIIPSLAFLAIVLYLSIFFASRKYVNGRSFPGKAFFQENLALDHISERLRCHCRAVWICLNTGRSQGKVYVAASKQLSFFRATSPELRSAEQFPRYCRSKEQIPPRPGDRLPCYLPLLTHLRCSNGKPEPACPIALS
jgi:hypothetical protein